MQLSSVQRNKRQRFADATAVGKDVVQHGRGMLHDITAVRWGGYLSLAGGIRTSGANLAGKIIASTWLLLAALDSRAEPDLRFAKRFQMPGSSAVVVVAEGDFEPRSIGTYALRVYGGASKNSPTDDFVAGVIWSRKGIIEAVRFDDIDGDDRGEIVVITRSVGSGGYLSADAFRYRGRSLEWVASVSDLDKRADPIRALRNKVPAQKNNSAAPEIRE